MVWRVADVVDICRRGLGRVPAGLRLDGNSVVRHLRRDLERIMLSHDVGFWMW